MKRAYINIVQAAEELGITHPAVVQLLKARLIVGARKVGGRWRIPTPVRRKEGARGFKSKQAQQQAEFLASLPELADMYKLHCCPIAELSQRLGPDSIDCIITDPPYGREALPLYSELAAMAKVVLKPGGSLLCMAGQSYLLEVYRSLGEHLTYKWQLCYFTPGGQGVQIWDRKVISFWKPVVWYVKGKSVGIWDSDAIGRPIGEAPTDAQVDEQVAMAEVNDVATSAVNDNDKRFHRWGQSESGMAELLDRASNEGDIILDPFLGGGTTAVVALRMGRKFIGADSDPEAIKTTLSRLQDG